MAVFVLIFLRISETIWNIMVKFSVLVSNTIDNLQNFLDSAIQNIGMFMTNTMQINTKASLFFI